MMTSVWGARVRIACLVSVVLCATASAQNATLTIVRSRDASPIEDFAAREIQRYLYLCTGDLFPVVTQAPDADAIVVTQSNRGMVDALRGSGDVGVDSLGPQDYLLHSQDASGHRVLYIVGGSDIAALYGAYRFVEHLGVRFYLHGDVIPDRREPLSLPKLHETASPLFSLRGIQPFHDFPEGPDWWNTDDYEAIIGQLPKMRMNFIGLHTYPEDRPNAEPTVWIGRRDDVTPQGDVTFSYPAIYYNTALPVNWGLQPKSTSDYACGAAALFSRDDYGSEIMEGLAPRPESPEDCNEVFNRTGTMFRNAFGLAKTLGVKTCVGTETPLVVPKRVQERGGEVADLYQGMFTRIMRAYPIDYYWLWTPEPWTWEGTTPEAAQRTVDDILTARAAIDAVETPFKLATCGWVLGPQFDRAYLDGKLPKDIALSCISRSVGHDPVEPAFADVTGRETWAIPWLEDDPAMTSPQLWAGRMRRDARDALAYGCTGLMGIHWRTRILAPNVAALAQAAWTQADWATTEPSTGPVGGATVRSGDQDIPGTEDDPLYLSVRYNMRAYNIAVPNGTYMVSLYFCEPHYDEAGKRVFGVNIEGRNVVEHLDVFRQVGKNGPLEIRQSTTVADGYLNIDFVPETEFPCIAAIAVEGIDFAYKVNCGGDAYRDFGADPEPISDGVPADDFYVDWALHEFGPEIGADAARIFSAIDGKLPRPSDWIGGPGGYRPDTRPWDEVAPEYAFVDDLRALQPRLAGPGDKARFAYWLETFEFLRATGRMRCAWSVFDEAMKQVEAETDPAKQRELARQTALPQRIALIEATEAAYRHLLAAVSTTGGMGTVANLEQHTFPAMLDVPRERLVEILGESLPETAMLRRDYKGPPRLIVPSVQTSVSEGEDLTLRVIVLDEAPPQKAMMHVRPVGDGEYAAQPLQIIARNTLKATVPYRRIPADGLEYYLEITTAGGETVRWPTTARMVNQTVIRGPAASSR